MKIDYKALVTDEMPDGKFVRTIKTLNTNDLPSNEVLIRVHYSALNYKDCLSANGHKGITRSYPHVPGIDAAGVVVSSKSNEFAQGEEVFVTGYDLGMNTYGGFGEYICVPSDWLLKKPNNVTLYETMLYGTAGFTAATAIVELQENGIEPNSGKVLITGASGGVGTMAVAMLAKLGYSVVASTGKLEQKELLFKNGASEVISREDVVDKSGRPLLAKRWAAALDNVGGNALSSILRSTKDFGVVCSCGMVESTEFSSNVFPFILRATRLIGIASADTPMNRRKYIWNKIFNNYRLEEYNFPIKVITINELIQEIDIMSVGKQFGRVILKHS